MKKREGFSLIEILVVIAVFAAIGVVTSQAVVTTLRGARRADSDSKVRQSVDYAMSIMERQLRGATSVTCPNPDPTIINFSDADNVAQSFSLVTSGSDRYIAFTTNANRLTSNEVVVQSANFNCTKGDGNVCDQVTINLVAADPLETGSNQSTITTNSQVCIRTNL